MATTTDPLRTVPLFLLCPGDKVDREKLAISQGWEPAEHDKYEFGDIEEVIVTDGRVTLIFADDEVWGGLIWDDLAPIHAPLMTKCPDCTELHDTEACVSEFRRSGLFDCDCCRAIGVQP